MANRVALAVAALLLVLSVEGAWGAVTFDSVSIEDVSGSVQTFTGTAWTIGPGANRAAIIDLVFIGNVTGITASIGGVSGVLIAGTNTVAADATYQVALVCVTNPPSGSQQVTVSWTTAATLVTGTIVATGVDQTTPCANGANLVQAFGVGSLAITSRTGDLTVSAGVDALNTFVTNQTLKWGGAGKPQTQYGGDIGQGTGTTTHTYNNGGSSHFVLAGANFQAVRVTAPTASARLPRPAHRLR
jgi:hypothetical protein